MPRRATAVSVNVQSNVKRMSAIGARQRKPRKNRSTPAGVSAPVKRYVQRAIHTNLENKSITVEVAKTMANISNLTNFQSGNIFQLTPSSATNNLYTITQGLGEGSRTGNQVSLRKAIFRFVMYPLAYNAVSNLTPKPLDIGMWIVSGKKGIQCNNIADLATILNSNFFANGSTSVGMLGTLYDLVSVVNNDVITVHKFMKFKLGASNAQLQTGVTADKSNNDYKYNIIRKINVTKYIPKKITFDDANNSSTSKQVFIVFAPINADGTGIASTQFPCAIFAGLDVQYEDA